MQSETKKITLNGDSYELRPLSPTRNVLLATEAVQLFGESFVTMLIKGLPSKGASDEDGKKGLVQALVGAIMGFKGVDPQQVQEWMKAVLSSVRYIPEDGKAVEVSQTFDVHFQKRMKNLLALVGQTAVFQFADFFGGAVSGFKDLVGAAE